MYLEIQSSLKLFDFYHNLETLILLLQNFLFYKITLAILVWDKKFILS